MNRSFRATAFSLCFSVAMATSLLGTARPAGAEPLCSRCGQVEGCHKSCRFVQETKKVQVTCWSCQSEDFCIPYRSTRGCKNCDEVCGEAPDSQGVCSQPKKFTWWDWMPGCGAHVHTKKKLMKKTVTKTVPSYKWVVENLCDKCQAACDQEEAAE